MTIKKENRFINAYMRVQYVCVHTHTNITITNTNDNTAAPVITVTATTNTITNTTTSIISSKAIISTGTTCHGNKDHNNIISGYHITYRQ